MKTNTNNIMSVAQRYSYDINIDERTAAAEVVRLTGKNKRVLELGPGPGTILRYLERHSHCLVSAVELDPECVASLQRVCDIAVEGDLDKNDWLNKFQGQQFDVIIAADVLEHLKNPWQCLENARTLLAPTGFIIISIPNVGHNSILASLISGRFPYQPRGLLDRTHLRFFTRHDFEKALLATGFLPSEWHAINMLPESAELGHNWLDLSQSQQAMLNANPYGNDYQYVVKAFASTEAGTVARAESLNDETRAINTRQLEELQRLKDTLSKTEDVAKTALDKIAEQVDLYQKQENHYSELVTQLKNNLESANYEEKTAKEKISQQIALYKKQEDHYSEVVAQLTRELESVSAQEKAAQEKIAQQVGLYQQQENQYSEIVTQLKRELESVSAQEKAAQEKIAQQVILYQQQENHYSDLVSQLKRELESVNIQEKNTQTKITQLLELHQQQENQYIEKINHQVELYQQQENYYSEQIAKLSLDLATLDEQEKIGQTKFAEQVGLYQQQKSYYSELVSQLKHDLETLDAQEKAAQEKIVLQVDLHQEQENHYSELVSRLKHDLETRTTQEKIAQEKIAQQLGLYQLQENYYAELVNQLKSDLSNLDVQEKAAQEKIVHQVDLYQQQEDHYAGLVKQLQDELELLAASEKDSQEKIIHLISINQQQETHYATLVTNLNQNLEVLRVQEQAAQEKIVHLVALYQQQESQYAEKIARQVEMYQQQETHYVGRITQLKQDLEKLGDQEIRAQAKIAELVALFQQQEEQYVGEVAEQTNLGQQQKAHFTELVAELKLKIETAITEEKVVQEKFAQQLSTYQEQEACHLELIAKLKHDIGTLEIKEKLSQEKIATQADMYEQQDDQYSELVYQLIEELDELHAQEKLAQEKFSQQVALHEQQETHYARLIAQLKSDFEAVILREESAQEKITQQVALYEQQENHYSAIVSQLNSNLASINLQEKSAQEKIAQQVVLYQQQEDHYAGLVSELKGQLNTISSCESAAQEKILALVNMYQQQQDHYSALAFKLTQDLASSTAENQNLHQLQIANTNYLNDLSGQLQNANRRIEELWASTSWRLTRPLRWIKKIGGQSQSQGLRSKLRDTYRILPYPVQSALDKVGMTGYFRNLALPTETAVTLLPPPSMQRVESHFVPLSINQNKAQNSIIIEPEDVFFWGVIDWHFRFQRPQQLALGFAKRQHRVFYVSSELINDEKSGFKIDAIPEHPNVFQIRFHANNAAPIYTSHASGALLHQLQQGLAQLLIYASTKNAISVVQHPYWLPLARSLPNSHMAYDCMDHHEGFGDSPPDAIAAERALMRESDTLIVTSDWLYDIAKDKNKNISIVRNACEFEHFNQPPETRFEDPEHRKIIGYFGAIADWFDCVIIEKLAAALPDCLILLVGNDTCGAAKKFSRFNNIKMTGEVSYKTLPYYLYSFDVCLLPFQIIDLTLATNPVKVYEYMCSGKPIVSVNLPELKDMDKLVYLAKDTQEFINMCVKALEEPANANVRRKRVKFASEQTWVHRAQEFELALEKSIPPLVSIVVVTYNNLDLTKLCLNSIDANTTGVRYEIIIVDNASSDGSPEYLRQFAENRGDVKLILNDDNTGFSKANNQGLAAAKGDYLVVLNNDTVVTMGWAAGLLRHCKKDSTIGLIGPVTNNIGNEAKINIDYASLDEMPAKAKEYTLAHLGESFDIHTLAFFCVMITREAYEKIGGLDEAFGLGFFEDDDYCRRIEQAGHRIVCVDDVFIHHNLSASFNKLGQERKQELFVRNKAIYEAKWGTWIPHTYRL
ncbi:glycosyltransferase [Undibacterium sp. 5I1]|uniref:glycosyltransferase n=1 Tax=unclassified Undibacterium TaxID=2630295 RepID=UPI002AB50F0F|nr:MULTISPECIES: glycosyltransferase [unclassified Undibacterium]MDY7539941.1 glycosyltransferase [Undibacterium sp. 5I1]MEB0230548.1 glycosyltransferase [Undibacterium sp. 10I3]MEB0257246.1 glycosyltransferase [Undibacterium sp. 5I1]